MATAAQWVSGARLRTLPLAIAPVIIGTGAALGLAGGLPDQFIGGASGPGHAAIGRWQWMLRFVLALGVALLLQIGTNYANDYSDGVRGTDEDRVGPERLTAAGLAPPRAVKSAAFGSFAGASALGIVLIVISQSWWFLLIGALCLPAAWYYTGGKRPYGYAGLGEVFVFIFFGLVATLGTTYTQVHMLSLCAWGSAAAIGLISCALLMANNLRDIPSDADTGKRTLAVRLGDSRARYAYAILVAVPFLLLLVPIASGNWGALLALLALVAAIGPVKTVLSGSTGASLVPVLKQTGTLAIVYGVLLALGLSL